MTTPAEALRECPFCAKPLRISAGYNQYGRCETENCWMHERKMIVPLDDSRQVEQWNTRTALTSPAPAPDVAVVVERLESHMGKQDVGVLLADCRIAATLLTTLSAENARLVEAKNGARAISTDRETLGRFVREAWVRWAQTQPSPKPTWLVPYDDLSEPDKEADRQIGEAVARWTLIHDAANFALTAPSERPVPNACRDLLLSAISDWKAPYEVAKIVNYSGEPGVISKTLRKLVADGFAEHHEGNNTYRAIERPANPITKGRDHERRH